MHQYRASLRDIDFVLNELLESSKHYEKLEGCSSVDSELVEAVIQGAAKFIEEVVAPLYRSGDEQGCKFQDGPALRGFGPDSALSDIVATCRPCQNAAVE